MFELLLNHFLKIRQTDILEFEPTAGKVKREEVNSMNGGTFLQKERRPCWFQR